MISLFDIDNLFYSGTCTYIKERDGILRPKEYVTCRKVVTFSKITAVSFFYCQVIVFIKCNVQKSSLLFRLFEVSATN